MPQLFDIDGYPLISDPNATREDLVRQLLATGGEALATADLSELHLVGLNFRGIIFRGARFDQATLSDSDFTGCAFHDCYMRWVLASATSFRNTVWSHTRVLGAEFEHCSFGNASLNYTRLDRAETIGCDFAGASGANLPNPQPYFGPTAPIDVDFMAGRPPTSWAVPEREPSRRCNTCATALDLSEKQTCKPCLQMRSARRRAVKRDGRKFGVEIEFILMNDYGDPLDSYIVADELVSAGIACADDGYTHDIHPNSWKIVSDASVEGGWELVSPPMLWSQRWQVETVCETLSGLNADIDSQCGLHVHHDVSDLPITSVRRLAERWALWQPFTDLLTHRSRANCYWAKHLSANTLAQVRDLKIISQLADSVDDRYQALNMTCHSRYGTVEMRQHEGTTSAAKILAWVAYGQAVIHGAHKRTPVPTTDGLESFLDALPFQGRDLEREDLKATGARRF